MQASFFIFFILGYFPQIKLDPSLIKATFEALGLEFTFLKTLRTSQYDT